jgi:pimeloyl-ACP methyl ester carboxylesterase
VVLFAGRSRNLHRRPLVLQHRSRFPAALRERDGRVPINFMTGVYDFVCAPEMTRLTTEKVKGSECLIMEGIGHFPMSENPEPTKISDAGAGKDQIVHDAPERKSGVAKRRFYLLIEYVTA